MSDANTTAPSAAYEAARARYAAYGIDTETALARLAAKPISMHCWQGDDVQGFDQGDNPASGGIMTTGNYPGRARNFEELTADFAYAASLIPGAKRVNLHASYAVFSDENPWHDRDQLTYEDYRPWVEWAREQGFGIDFNPTFFSHPRVNHGLTVSSPDAETREFWIRHGICCRQIAERIGEELDDEVLLNFWIPDGLKDTPTDRYGLRKNLVDALTASMPSPRRTWWTPSSRRSLAWASRASRWATRSSTRAGLRATAGAPACFSTPATSTPRRTWQTSSPRWRSSLTTCRYT